MNLLDYTRTVGKNERISILRSIDFIKDIIYIYVIIILILILLDLFSTRVSSHSYSAIYLDVSTALLPK